MNWISICHSYPCPLPPLWSTLPRDLEIGEFGKKFSAIQKTSNNFRMRKRASECIMWHRFCWDADIVESRVEVECRVLFYTIGGRLHATFDHVHVGKCVNVDSEIGEWPIRVSRPLRRRL